MFDFGVDICGPRCYIIDVDPPMEDVDSKAKQKGNSLSIWIGRYLFLI